MTDRHISSGTITNGYDTLDQLTSSSSTKSVNPYSHSYVPDAAGNLPSVHGVSYGLNSRNQVNNTGFVYDGNGNPTTYKGNSASFDAENRMTSYGSGFAAAYRADGLRAWKQAMSQK